MALVSRTGLFERVLPLVQAKRFRGKINIQRPRAPHFIRQAYLDITKPWFISKYKDTTTVELCKLTEEKSKKTTEAGPFERIIARELHQYFTNSRLVIFFHDNPMKGEDRTKALIAFTKSGMIFKKYGLKTLELAVKGTPYEAVLGFYVSKNMLLFSKDPNIKEVMKINKKFPQLVMLAGILDGKFINKDELVKYSVIPNIETAQASFVQTLNSLGSRLVQQLNTHQTCLVSNLEERVKQLQEENK